MPSEKRSSKRKYRTWSSQSAGDGVKVRRVRAAKSASGRLFSMCAAIERSRWVRGGSLQRFAPIVPQPDDRLVAAVVLEAEHADAGRVAEVVAPGRRREAEPAGRYHPDDGAAGKSQDVAGSALDAGDEAVRAGRDVSRRFSVRTAVSVKLPAGSLLDDVPRHLAFESPIVPLQQIRVQLRAGPESGEFARPGRTLQGAGEN